MADQNDRAQLGEQTEDEGMVARPSQSDSNDSNAGDEGIDDSRGSAPRGSRISRKSGIKTSSAGGNREESEESSSRPQSDRNESDGNESDRNQADGNDPDLNDADMRGAGSSGDSGEFAGQGGQKDGNYDNAQGTGYTNDHTGQLQDDGSLSGADGGTDDSKRVGGQTAQNPRK